MLVQRSSHIVKIRGLSRLLSTKVPLPEAQATSQKFQFNKSTETISDVINGSEGFQNKNIILNGWIDKKPKKIGKNLIFSTFRDTNGDKIQLVDSISLLKNLNAEDVIQIEGQIDIKRAASGVETATEYEIKLQDLKVLNHSNEKPTQLQDKKLTEVYPPEYRVLQLRLPKQQQLLKQRYELGKFLRALLDSEKFVEIETPILFKPTPEGAREFLVPTRSGSFYALTQSPQQYKQLLIAGGVSRYFQIARCFRDEDLRKDRQPEFTQLDLEMGFANGEDVMKVIQDAISKSWKRFSKVTNKQLMTLDKNGALKEVQNGADIYRMPYKEAMSKYGIDKPDLRAPDLQIMNLKEFKVKAYQNLDFPTFEVIILRNVVDSQEDFEQNWSHLLKKDNYSNRTPIGVPILSEELQSNWFEKFSSIASFENPNMLNKFLNLKKGDIVFGCSREADSSVFECPTPLGRLRQLILSEKRGQDIFFKTQNDVATWVVEFPLFSPIVKKASIPTDYPKYETERLCSTHHPFTMVKLNDYDKISKEPLQCIGQHYDFVMNGVELGGGSTRVHDREFQDFIFENILKIDNAKELFGHLLDALAMGTPPHAGFAIGFDRMCAMLFGKESIRDVLAFPKSITGSDLVVKSPSHVDEDVLKEYNIKYLSKD